jgi:tight adherence protein C
VPADPFLLALLAAGCVVLAGYGLLLFQTPPLARLELDVVTGTTRRTPPITRFLEAVGRRYGPRYVRSLSDVREQRLRTRLVAAGQPGRPGLDAYGSRKVGYLALFGGAGVVLVLLGSWLSGSLLVLIGWFWADLVLIGGRQRRQAEIERQMPDFLDVLAVTVGAGLGFRAALGRVSEGLGGPLAEELRQTLRQLDVGESRRKAFLELRDRNSSESLGTFVSAFLQAEELGAPLGGALVEIAADIRREGAQVARRTAARTSPRVSLVVSFLMVPAAMLLLGVGIFLSAGDGVFDVFGP